MPGRNPWIGIGADAWMLGLEAASVIALRTAMLAGGGARAQAEAVRMVSEKAEAAAALQMKAALGMLGLTSPAVAAASLGHYRRRVRSNRRRLSK